MYPTSSAQQEAQYFQEGGQSTSSSVIVRHPSAPVHTPQPELPARTPDGYYYDPSQLQYSYPFFPFSEFGSFNLEMLQSPSVDASSASSSSGTPVFPLPPHFSHRLAPLTPSSAAASLHGAPQHPHHHTTHPYALPLTGGGVSGASGLGGQPMGVRRAATGGRRPKEFEMADDPNDDDYMKKVKRRERNKEAAARCRQRRLDLMQQLQEQVDFEKEKNREKERVIEDMKERLTRLQQFIQQHDCKMSSEDRARLPVISMPALSGRTGGGGGGGQNGLHVPVTSHQQHHHNMRAPPPQFESLKRPLPPISAASRENIGDLIDDYKPEYKMIKVEDPNPTLTQVTTAAYNVDRPSSLSLGGDSVAGPALTTPSNLGYNAAPTFGTGLNLPSFGLPSNFDGLLSQQTGLTPSTNNPMNFAAVTSTPTPLGNGNELRDL